MSRAVWALSAFAITLVGAQYVVGAPVSPWLANSAWTASGLAAIAGCAHAARNVREPRRRAAWRWLLAGSSAWLVGQLVWDLYALAGVTADLPSPADLAWLLFAVLAAGGVVQLGAPGRLTRSFRRLEAATVAFGVTGITVALLWGDIQASALDDAGLTAAVLYAVLYVAVVAALVQALPRTRSLRGHRDLLLLLGGFTLEAVAFTWWTPLLLDGAYEQGRSPIDAIWVAGLVLIAAAGLAAPRTEPLPEPSLRETRRGSLIPALLLVCVIAALAVTAALDAPLGARLALIAACGLMSVLLMVRSWQFSGAVVAAEEELDRYLELAPVMLGVSRRGGFLRVNPAFTATLGWSEEELLSKPLLELVHPDDEQVTLDAIAALADDRPVALESRWRHRDGGHRWLSWSVVPDPEHDLNYATARDITELKSVQAELERSNADLERFAYAASHDLAEPLRTISSFSQLALRDAGEQLGDRPRRHLGHVIEAAERQRALIDAMLGYSRVGRRALAPQPVDLGALVGDTVTVLDAQLAEQGATVTADALPVVTGDPVELGQLLQNLISNAVKFHGDEPPRVHVGGGRENGGWHITVRDNGIGIDERHRARIFEMFQRLHSRADYAGTGIGLALCAKIAERHGGAIWVDSEPGAGSTFHVTLHDSSAQEAVGARA